jgi:hypothetical protein
MKIRKACPNPHPPISLASTCLALALCLSFTQTARAGAWFTKPPLITERELHTATLLANGKVLVAGGTDSLNAELYDPATGVTVATSPMNVPRYGHTATLLRDGRVLVAGGYNHEGLPDSSCLGSAELYDPATGLWTPTAPLKFPRACHTMTLLPNGKVLVAGGVRFVGGSIDSVELFDPAEGTWTVTASLAAHRYNHTATLLPNGKVLVAGGSVGSLPPPGPDLAGAELYDPLFETWTPTGPLNCPRQDHTATLLPDGTVLVAGGARNYVPTASAEVYDPASGLWTAVGALNTTRDQHTATLLQDGKLLLTGGYDSNGVILASTELYDTASATWTPAAAMHATRFYHAATSLADGQVLVTGGDTGVGVTNSTELFDYLSVPVPIPTTLAGARKLGNGSFQFQFTNTPGASCVVLATTNAALQLKDWTPLPGVLEVTAGQFQFTDPHAANEPHRFYRLLGVN